MILVVIRPNQFEGHFGIVEHGDGHVSEIDGGTEDKWNNFGVLLRFLFELLQFLVDLDAVNGVDAVASPIFILHKEGGMNPLELVPDCGFTFFLFL